MIDRVKNVSLDDETLFSLQIGKRRTKKELQSLPKGDIPIISARLDKPFGHISSEEYKSFPSKTVLWNIDSSRWDTRVLEANKKFIPTDHCGCLEVEDKNIVPEYIAYKLYEIGLHLGFKHEFRASLANVGSISLPVPILPDGNFDVQEQERLANKYYQYLEAKNKLLSIIADLTSKHVRFASSSKFARIAIGDFMLFEKGKSVYTAKYCKMHEGAYPVYSAGTKGKNTIGHIDKYVFEKECLKITTNGYAGTVEYLPKSKFSLNGDVGILYFENEKYNREFDYRYLEYALQSVREEYGFGWNNKPSETDINNIEVEVPVRNGVWDIDEQKRLADLFVKYQNAVRKLQADVEGLDRQFVKVDQ